MPHLQTAVTLNIPKIAFPFMTVQLLLIAEPSILQYHLQKDQQMLKEVVDVLLTF
jgi:hypothetical protein